MPKNAKPPIVVDGAGLRYDDDKPRVDLIPPEAIFALGDLYRIGMEKYAERNWERGMPWSKVFGPLVRHTWKFWRGEEYDDETGVHHMVHVAWNAIALYVYVTRKIGKDDRHIVRDVD